MINIEIKKVFVKTNTQGISGIVFRVDTELKKFDGIKVASIDRTFSFNKIEDESFIPLSSIKKSDIISWVSSLIVGKQEEHINKLLDDKLNSDCEIDISLLP